MSIHIDMQTPLNSNVGVNNRKTKDKYLFVVDNSSEANSIDWSNTYIEMNFKLSKTADNAKIGAGVDHS